MTAPHVFRSFPAQWRQAFTRTLHGRQAAGDDGPRRSGLSTTAIAVGFVLASYADTLTGENIRPGLERVAAGMGISVATVKRAVRDLHGAGWIATTEVGSYGRASVYKLTIPPLFDTATGEIPTPRNGVTSDTVTGGGRKP